MNLAAARHRGDFAPTRTGDPFADTTRRVLAKGDRIRASSVDAQFGEITSGLLAVKRVSSYGEYAVVDLLGPGSTLGGNSILGQAAAEGDATMLEALLPTQISWHHTQENEDLRSEIVPAVLAVFACRARRQQTVALRRQRQSISQRMADLLLDLWSMRGPRFDAWGADGLTRRDLGEIVGSDRSVASQIWSRFERRGWLFTLDGKLVDLDEAALGVFADRDAPPRGRDVDERLLAHQRRLASLVRECNYQAEESLMAAGW